MSRENLQSKKHVVLMGFQAGGHCLALHRLGLWFETFPGVRGDRATTRGQCPQSHPQDQPLPSGCTLAWVHCFLTRLGPLSRPRWLWLLVSSEGPPGSLLSYVIERRQGPGPSPRDPPTPRPRLAFVAKWLTPLAGVEALYRTKPAIADRSEPSSSKTSGKFTARMQRRCF